MRPVETSRTIRDSQAQLAKSINEPVAGSTLPNYFYGGFKLGRLANNKRMAALQ
jgi:hypothetical protein